MARGIPCFTGVVLWALVLGSLLYASRLLIQTKSMQYEVLDSQAAVQKARSELEVLRSSLEDSARKAPYPVEPLVPSPPLTLDQDENLLFPPLPPLPSALEQPPERGAAGRPDDGSTQVGPARLLPSQNNDGGGRRTPAKRWRPRSRADTPLPAVAKSPGRSSVTAPTVSGKVGQERKCAHSDVRAEMSQLGASFDLLDPKDERVTALNDFPCPETEMHACACQVKCRDSSCSGAVRLCHRLSSASQINNASGSAHNEPAMMETTTCAAVVLAEGTIWATLKRGATPAESLFLKLRDATDLAQAEAMVADLERVNPKWHKRLDPQGGDSEPITIERSPLGFTAQSIQSALLLADGISGGGVGSPPSVKNPVSRADDALCHGGPVQGKGVGALVRGDSDWLGSESSSQGSPSLSSWSKFLKGRIGVVALSMKTPASLAASMTSWQSSGLLDLVGDERVALLSEPLPAELALARHFGFRVVQPQDLVASGAAPLSRAAGPNRFTIGSAFHHALAHAATSDYVLFLEKDFAVDEESFEGAAQELAKELVAAAWLLEQGAMLVRLRSRRDMGCSGFRTCANGANRPEWSGKTTRARRRNWLSYYCEGDVNQLRGKGLVADCVQPLLELTSTVESPRPHFRCFTSWDSNWSLNAVMVHRRAMLEQVLRDPDSKGRNGHMGNWSFETLARYGESKFDDQAGFERGLLDDNWGRLRVPLCLSVNGVFRHHEVDN